MSYTDAMASAGFTPEKSTVGDKYIYEGVYKANYVEGAKMADKGYGESYYAQFKVNETSPSIPSVGVNVLKAPDVSCAVVSTNSRSTDGGLRSVTPPMVVYVPEAGVVSRLSRVPNELIAVAMDVSSLGSSGSSPASARYVGAYQTSKSIDSRTMPGSGSLNGRRFSRKHACTV